MFDNYSLRSKEEKKGKNFFFSLLFSFIPIGDICGTWLRYNSSETWSIQVLTEVLVHINMILLCKGKRKALSITEFSPLLPWVHKVL